MPEAALLLCGGGRRNSATVTGADLEKIAEAEARMSVELPVPVRRLYEAADGIWDESGQWWIVWPLSRVTEKSAPGPMARCLVTYSRSVTTGLRQTATCLRRRSKLV